MELQKLDNSFYQDHCHLINALDNYKGSSTWGHGKIRGYGVVVIKLKNLTFATKNAMFPLTKNINKTEGLDYSKALLITNKSYLFNEPFKVDSKKYIKIKDSGKVIREGFEKYVSRYIRGVEKLDQRILTKWEYLNTTLKNYHKELGLES